MKQSILGLYYEDFVVGEEIQHALSKTIFESDNNLFSLLTMNHHPVRTNMDYALKNQHGQILVVGTLVFSLVVGMTVPDIVGRLLLIWDMRILNILLRYSSTIQYMQRRKFFPRESLKVNLIEDLCMWKQ